MIPLRLAGLLFLLFPIVSTGCTTMHTASRSDAADIRLLNDRFHDRPATVRFTDGSTATGVVQFVRADSIGWTAGDVNHAVLLDDVARLTRQRDGTALRNGMLIGAGIGAVLALAMLTESKGDDFEAQMARGMAKIAIPTSVAYGAIFGESVGRRRVYILQP